MIRPRRIFRGALKCVKKSFCHADDSGNRHPLHKKQASKTLLFTAQQLPSSAAFLRGKGNAGLEISLEDSRQPDMRCIRLTRVFSIWAPLNILRCRSCGAYLEVPDEK